MWFNFFHNFLTLSRVEWDMIKNVYWSSSTVPVIFSRFLMKLEFSRQIFQKSNQIHNFMKVRAELFHANGQADMAKVIVAWRYFPNAPKIVLVTPTIKTIILSWTLSSSPLSLLSSSPPLSSSSSSRSS